MEGLWQFVLAIIASVGGIGVILVGLASWAGRIWANAVSSFNLANRQIQANAPFIPGALYDLFSHIRDDCRMQINWFSCFMLEPDMLENRKEMKDEYRECYQRTRNISESLDNLFVQLREYLVKLDVIE